MNNSQKMSLFHLWVTWGSYWILYRNHIHASSLCLQTAAGCGRECVPISLIDDADTCFHALAVKVNSLPCVTHGDMWRLLACLVRGRDLLGNTGKVPMAMRSISAYTWHRFPIRLFTIPELPVTDELKWVKAIYTRTPDFLKTTQSKCKPF